MNIEHDVYLPAILERASKGLCDCNCTWHDGDVKVVRVFGKDCYDWGLFLLL